MIMLSTRTTNLLLTVIAILLAVIALRSLIESPTVRAQSSASMQMVVGLQAIAQPSTLNGGAVDTTSTSSGLLLFDQSTGNVWGYPMYTLSLLTGKIAPNFGQPTLYGTFNGPGQPMLPPTPTQTTNRSQQ